VRIKTKNSLKAILFLIPVLLLISIFFFYPLINVFVTSFQKWSVLGSSEWIGLKNYKETFKDLEFWKSLWNTIIYTLIVTPMIFLPAIIFATLLSKTSKSSNFFRVLFFLPNVISFVVASYVWLWIYNDTIGILNYILISLNFISQPISWLGSTWLSRIMVSLMVSWKTFGFSMMILIAGLQSIPLEVYEAAKIDGATKFQEFYCITLPLLRPTLILALIISIAGSFKAFDHFYIMTTGGPLKTTQTIVMYINKVGFEYYDIGRGSAISVIFLIILLIISYLQLKLGGFTND